MAYQAEGSSSAQYCPIVDWELAPGHYAPSLWRGRAVDATAVPHRGVLKSKHKKLPDVFGFKGSFMVCGDFRRIIEDFEPGVHQFFPVEVIKKNRQPVPGNGRYYAFNVMQKFDSLLTARSNVQWIDVDAEKFPGVMALHPGRGPLQIVLSRPQIAGRHVWRGDRLLGGAIYFSDQLVDALQAAKLKQLRYTYVREVDEIWDPAENLSSG